MPKILHCADLHLDSPFKSGNAGKSEVRRRELRGTFSSLIMYIKDNGIPLALMAGDLFDRESVTRETADFFFGEMASASGCRFVISPGNHDPYLPGSVYAGGDIPSNVYIFNDTALNRFCFPEIGIDVYGYAFTKSTLDFCPFVGREPADLERINLLCGHADVGDPLSPYCPVSEKDIAATGFDYCAFGHIHNSVGMRKVGGTYYAYSGCLEGRDFGETGHKGAILLDITKERGIASVKATGVRFSKRRYEICRADVSGCRTADELNAKLRSAIAGKYGSDTLLRLVMTGNVSPSLAIRTDDISARFGDGLFYIEAVDHTLPLYDSDALRSDPTIRGAFFRELLPQLENGSPEERSDAARALRLGLMALNGEREE